MKKLIVLLTLLNICACATPPMKPAELQSKVAVGMSVADVISILDIPDEKKPQDPTKFQLIYPGFFLNFTDDKLTSVQAASSEATSELSLKPVEELKPGYKPDSLVLNKEIKSAAPVFKIAGYLQSEVFFDKAIEAKADRNGFTIKSNALCVGLTEGYLKGTETILKTGYYPDVRLRTDKGTYIYPKDCVAFQKNPAVAEQLKTLLANSEADRAARAAAKKAAELKSSAAQSSDVTSSDSSSADKKDADEDEDSKFSFDWQAVKDFLKPVGPLPDGKHPEPSKTAPQN